MNRTVFDVCLIFGPKIDSKGGNNMHNFHTTPSPKKRVNATIESVGKPKIKCGNKYVCDVR